MQDHVGYLLGNMKRKQILETLESRGALKSAAIAHLVRLPPKMAEKILAELQGRKLIELSGESYKLTDGGKEAMKKLTKVGAVG